jgi:SAM-dependent methyltransferase
VTTELARTYAEFYRSRDPQYVYPVEFVVRALLGRYPRLASPRDRYEGQRILDLGFGDGRNMPLLANLGLEVHGVEMTEDICARTLARLARLGVAVQTRVGRNHAIPYEDAFFDHVLACHSCYYVEPGTRFEDNVREIARVTKGGGRLVFSAPMRTSYILRDARDLGDGHMQIAEDPYGVRNGCVLRSFESEHEIERVFGPLFEDLSIGSCRNDFWGIEEHVWIVAGRRSEAS